jgi:nicotinate-nucleotide adenylyltransferase
MDAFVSLDSWHEWESVIEYAHIIYSRRPGSELKIDNRQLRNLYGERFCEDRRELQQSAAGSIFEVPAPQLDISSTKVREMIKKNQSLAEVLPEEVQTFIRKEGIYNRH